MPLPILGSEFESAAPPAPVRGPWRGYALHAGLLLVTGYTLAFSGWWMWDGGSAVARWSDLANPSALRQGLPYALAVLAILGAHEMGHWLACRWWRIPATLPFVIPGIPPFGTFGALIRVRGIVPDRRALLDVAAAGPIAGLLVALPRLFLGSEVVPRETLRVDAGTLGDPLLVLAFGAFVPEDHVLVLGQVGVAGWFGLLVTSLNLFPVGQLDGGHAIYAFSRRWHRRVSHVTGAALIGFVVLETLARRQVSAYALWAVVIVALRDRHPRLLDEATPLSPGRRIVVVILALLFLLTFVPRPFIFE